MQRHALAAFGVLILLLASVEPSDAARGTRKQCRQTCGPRIAQDCAPFRKAAKRACRRAILRACRRVSLESCFLTPATTTTTTTSLVPTTTDPPSTTTTVTAPLPTSTTQLVPTTTTTSKPPTTTTTLPFHFGGDWTFFGDLFSDDCAGEDPPFFDVDVLVSHTPGSSDVGVAVEFYPPLFGTADASGFDASNDFPDDDCTVTVAFAATRTGNPNLMDAALVIDVDCPESSCRVAYTGDLER
jgi:hypothetical protein